MKWTVGFAVGSDRVGSAWVGSLVACGFCDGSYVGESSTYVGDEVIVGCPNVGECVGTGNTPWVGYGDGAFVESSVVIVGEASVGL